MNIEQLKAVGETLIQWGFWIMIYGMVTIIIGLVIIIVCNKLTSRSFR
jgi:nitric oxide reductase large subunit